MESNLEESENYIHLEDKLSPKDYLDFLMRISVFVFILAFFSFVSYFLISHLISRRLLSSRKDILYVAPYKLSLLQGIGIVSEPELNLEVRTKSGYKKIHFLLDTGAVVSSLPRGMAVAMGYNLAFMPRTVFTGYGNTTSFAYRGDMVVKMGEKEVTLPVVFTQAAATQPLIGRKGMVDRFAIILDAQNKQVIIKEKG